jgi:hypothetical protein
MVRRAFVASISTFGLAGFSGAKLGKLSSGFCGDAEGGNFVEKHFNCAAVDPPRLAGPRQVGWSSSFAHCKGHAPSQSVPFLLAIPLPQVIAGIHSLTP